MTNNFDAIVALVEATKEDSEKFFVKENAQAGKRLRDAAKDIAALAKQLRKDVSAIKAERAAAKKATAAA